MSYTYNCPKSVKQPNPENKGKYILECIGNYDIDGLVQDCSNSIANGL